MSRGVSFARVIWFVMIELADFRGDSGGVSCHFVDDPPRSFFERR